MHWIKGTSILLCFVFLSLSACGVRHEYIQDQDGYLAYTQPQIQFLRENPRPEPVYCMKLEDISYDPPLKQNWFEKLFNIEKDKTFKGCRHKDSVRAANVSWEKAAVEKAGAMIHGLAFMAGTIGGAAILGSQINSGLRHQPGMFEGSNVGVSTLNNFSPGTIPTVFGPPIVR